jgi:CubicO group peptidase (beta-lactamase class C family)
MTIVRHVRVGLLALFVAAAATSTPAAAQQPQKPNIKARVNPLPGSVGEFFWQGAFGTVFWVDPQQKLVATMMLQTPFNQFDQYHHELR